MASLIFFIIVLAILVLSHEFGHFIAAKKTGMTVHEFGFGFPPRFFGIQFLKEKNPAFKRFRIVFGNRELNETDENYGTVYSLNWIPMGGFVKIKGENGEEENDPHSFAAKKNWQKAVVLFAGVVMNVLLAAVLLSLGYMIGLPQSLDKMADVSNIKDRRIEILGVLSGKPAEKNGVLAGDAVLQVGEIQNPRLTQMQDYINTNKDKEIVFKFSRDGQVIEKKITPLYNEETKKAGIGISIAELGTVKYSFFRSIFEGVKATGIYLKEIVLAFYYLIAGLFAGNGAGDAVSGPVGIAVMTGRVARLGIIYLIQFTAMLSLNLAVFNVLPIPALDGGRLLFLAIAAIRRKPVSQKLENIFHTVGFALLMLLVVVVTVRDLSNFKVLIINFFKRLM